MRKSITSHHNLALAIGAALLLSAAPASAQTRYNQVNLVSNIPGQAAVTDSSLVNPWGLAASTGSPWRVADKGVDLAFLVGRRGADVARDSH